MGVKVADECAESLTKVQIKTVESVIKIADKYGLDRDTTLRKFADKFAFMTELGIFKNYQIKEDK